MGIECAESVEEEKNKVAQCEDVNNQHFDVHCNVVIFDVVLPNAYNSANFL